MRINVFLLAFLAFLAWAAAAQAQPVGASFPPPTGGGGYTGPADVVASPTEFWGLRAASNAVATAGGALIDWNCASGAHTGTIHAATTGGMSTTDVSTMTTACGANTIYIAQFYGQIGGDNLTPEFTAERGDTVAELHRFASVFHLRGGGLHSLPILDGKRDHTQPALHMERRFGTDGRLYDRRKFPQQRQRFNSRGLHRNARCSQYVMPPITLRRPLPTALFTRSNSSSIAPLPISMLTVSPALRSQPGPPRCRLPSGWDLAAW